jgi:hypothetical protein
MPSRSGEPGWSAQHRGEAEHRYGFLHVRRGENRGRQPDGRHFGHPLVLQLHFWVERPHPPHAPRAAAAAGSRSPRGAQPGSAPGAGCKSGSMCNQVILICYVTLQLHLCMERPQPQPGVVPPVVPNPEAPQVRDLIVVTTYVEPSRFHLWSDSQPGSAPGGDWQVRPRLKLDRRVNWFDQTPRIPSPCRDYIGGTSCDYSHRRRRRRKMRRLTWADSGRYHHPHDDTHDHIEERAREEKRS